MKQVVRVRPPPWRDKLFGHDAKCKTDSFANVNNFINDGYDAKCKTENLSMPGWFSMSSKLVIMLLLMVVAKRCVASPPSLQFLTEAGSVHDGIVAPFSQPSLQFLAEAISSHDGKFQDLTQST